MSAVYAPGYVGDERTQMLIDSGAAVTLISTCLWHRVRVDGQREQVYEDNVVSASGEPLRMLGKAEVRIRLGNVDAFHTVLIADDITSDCLIGVDFLRKYQCTLEFGSNTLIVGGHRIRLGSQRGIETTENLKVAVAETVLVPERHEMIIEAVICTIDGEDVYPATGIVEPSLDTSASNDIVTAMTAVTPRGNQIPVRVANLSLCPVTLHQGMTLASFIPLMDPQDTDTGRKNVYTLINRDSAVSGGDSTVGKMDVRGVERGMQNSRQRQNKRRKQGRVSAMFDLTNLGLTDIERARLEKLLSSYEDVFSQGSDDLGRTDQVFHRINTGSAAPIKLPPRRLPAYRRDEVRQHLENMMDNEVIQPSSSPWAAPIVLVKKKDGTTRFCVDYRKLNSVTVKDAYPLPRIDDTLDALSGSALFTTLDLASGYWQVELDPAAREKSAFTTCHGLFEFKVMPFGLCNAPSTFQRLMELVMSGLQWNTCLVYLDDVIVFSANFDQHLDRLKEIFDRLRDAGLKLRPEKCHLLQSNVKFLGHVISSEGVATDQDKVKSVDSWPVPTDLKELRSFLGLATYYRRFVRGFSELAAPLYSLTEKDTPFVWNERCMGAFTALKQSLVTAPVLAYPNFEKEFVLDTDASDTGLGAVLSQVQDGQERVIAYASRVLTKTEKKYCATRKELLGLVFSVRYFRHYLYGRKFTVRTDHNALRWLRNFKEPEGQVARWLELLAEYNCVVEHRPGKKHSNADALSRRPCKQCGLGEKQRVSEVLAADTVTKSERPELREKAQWTMTYDLRSEQQADTAMRQIMDWKEDCQERPPSTVLTDKGPVLRSLWSQWQALEVHGGVLYRRWESNDGYQTRLQLVVPHHLVQTVLKESHDATSAGHLGITKTLDRIRERFYWFRLREDVEAWCHECRHCAGRKPPRETLRGPMVPSYVGYPFDRIAVDILGPLPETERCNKYIMVVADYFTRWTEAYAIPNQEAKTVAGKLVDEFICRFGAPVSLHSDQGRNFESALFKEVCDLLHIDKTRTTPYHPQSDGVVERFNRTLESMLSMYCSENQRDWDSHLPQVMLAYRSSVHETTRYTPYYLLYGREIRLPVDIMFGRVREEDQCATQYVQALRERLYEAYQFVRDRLDLKQKRQKEYYDRRVAGSPYQPGDKVWLHSPAVKRGQTRKLHHPWQGPYTVVKRLSDVTYRLQHENGRKRVVVHFNRLKPCALPATVETAAPNTIPTDSADAMVDRPTNPHRQKKRLAKQPHGSSDATAQMYDTDDEDYVPGIGRRRRDVTPDRADAAPAHAEPVARLHRNAGPPAWMQDYMSFN